MPLPEINVQIYRRIYVLEQWLRRIALAALTARYGSQWHGALPTAMSRGVNVRLEALRNRVAFDTENSDNAIWCLTLDEIKSLLTYEKAWPYVKALTEFDKSELKSRLDDLREIRNVIGHNRAATAYTAKLFEAISVVIESGISVFRDRLLYDLEGRQTSGAEKEEDVITRFYDVHSPLGEAQMATDEYFYYIHVVPRGDARPVGLGDMIEHFDPVRKVILAFLVNRRRPGEYSMIWPHASSSDEVSEVLRRFEQFHPSNGDDYSRQSPKYVCHPKVWFIY